MPYLETVDELTEALADMLGIYDQRLRFSGMSVAETRVYTAARQEWDRDHADDCGCRMCWTFDIRNRIRAAVANEARLAGGQRVLFPEGHMS